MNMTSKPKWQQSWKAVKIYRQEVWQIFNTQRATQQRKLIRKKTQDWVTMLHKSTPLHIAGQLQQQFQSCGYCSITYTVLTWHNETYLLGPQMAYTKTAICERWYSDGNDLVAGTYQDVFAKGFSTPVSCWDKCLNRSYDYKDNITKSAWVQAVVHLW
jgi:hypothetical protein